MANVGCKLTVGHTNLVQHLQMALPIPNVTCGTVCQRGSIHRASIFKVKDETPLVFISMI